MGCRRRFLRARHCCAVLTRHENHEAPRKKGRFLNFARWFAAAPLRSRRISSTTLMSRSVSVPTSRIALSIRPAHSRDARAVAPASPCASRRASSRAGLGRLRRASSPSAIFHPRRASRAGCDSSAVALASMIRSPIPLCSRSCAIFCSWDVPHGCSWKHRLRSQPCVFPP